MPTAVHNLSAVLLTFLEYHHRLVLGDVDSVYVSARLDAETRTGAAGGQITNRRHVDVFSGVKLECWLGRVNFEMDFALRVVEGGKLL